MKLKSRFVRPTVTAFFILSSLIASIGYWMLQNSFKQEFDSTVALEFQYVQNYIKVWTDGDVYLSINEDVLVQYQREDGSAYYVANPKNTELIERSENLEKRNAALLLPDEISREQILFTDAIMPNGNPARLATRIVKAEPGWIESDITEPIPDSVLNTEVVLAVARDRGDLTDAITQATIIFISVWVLANLAFWAVTQKIGNASLVPVTAIAEALPKVPDAPFEELKPLVQHLQHLDAKLKARGLQEERFTADAAHELRTPIAELRTITDVALAFPDDVVNLKETIAHSNKIALQLGSLVNALLGIAREETIRQDIIPRDIDIAALLQEIIELHADQLRAKDLTLTTDIPETHIHETDEALLKSILENLIGNAVAYAPKESTITIAYSGGSNGFRLDLSNSAPDLTKEDIAMLFEPFWRKSGSKTDRNHSGLGLALASSFAEILAMDLNATLLRDNHIQFTLSKS